ncbi:hypothetical protein HQ560_21940 [bacterium]|nr:hypothetical protein [bacterium]
MTVVPGRLLGIVFALAALPLPVLVAAEISPASRKVIAKSAMPVAMRRLAANASDDVGRDLIQLALAMDPQDKDALLVQGKLDAGKAIESSAPADVEAKFAEQMRGIAMRATTGFYKLLLHRVVAMVAPDDEAALLALTKAKNGGVDTRFGSLLKAAQGEWTKVIKSKTFGISVKKPWPFRVKVKKGDRIRITAKGSWRILPGGKPHGPGGSRFYLVGKLGAGAAFKVGSEYTFTVPDDTSLYLGMQEGGTYANNSGKITVTLQKLE